MKNKSEIFYSILVLLLMLIGCKQQKKGIDTSKYILLKDSTNWVLKSQYQIHMKLANYCREFLEQKDTFEFYPNRFICGYKDHKINSIYMGMIPGNYISKFFNELDKVDSLEHLAIFGTSVQKITELYRFNSLKTLQLHRIDFRDSLFVLPSHFSSLEKLSLRSMNIQNISFPKKNLIKNLKLQKLKLKKIDASFYFLKKLEKLDLYMNLFKVFNINLNEFPHLREVNLCHNFLSKKIKLQLIKKYPSIQFKFCDGEFIE